jgi:hypothetical protein
MAKLNLTVKGIPFSLDTSQLIPGIKEAVPQLPDADYIDLHNEIVTLITEENKRRGLQ